ncbi:MAG: AI-2E family transporter [Bdellovibrio sp.]|nr:AI-2E family transporter [Methylotenera sp.]
MQKSNAVDELLGGNARIFLLFLATGLAVYLCYLMVLPFVPALVWALALAVLFAPLQIWLESKIKYQSLAALLSVLVISGMVIVPVLFVGQQLALQAVSGAQLIEKKVESGDWRRLLNSQPRFAPIVEKIEQHINLPETVKTFTVWVSNSAGSFIKGSIYQLIGFVITIYLLFFFLRDRQSAKQQVANLLPLSSAQSQQLFKQLNDTIHATVYGTLAVAAVQGFLGGLMFWWLGLPAPLLWGVMMSVLAVIPVLGSSVIWLPAAVFLGLEGNWMQSIILVLWGMLVVGTVDNLLRPILVGNRLHQHTLFVFISLVGGLMLFGSSGLILGPVVLAITLFLMSIWSEKKSNQQSLLK